MMMMEFEIIFEQIKLNDYQLLSHPARIVCCLDILNRIAKLEHQNIKINEFLMSHNKVDLTMFHFNFAPLELSQIQLRRSLLISAQLRVLN